MSLTYTIETGCAGVGGRDDGDTLELRRPDSATQFCYADIHPRGKYANSVKMREISIL